MTRFRKQPGTPAGTVVFVGAGPGDPGHAHRPGHRGAGRGRPSSSSTPTSPPPCRTPSARPHPRRRARARRAASRPRSPRPPSPPPRAAASVVRLVAGDPYTSDAVVKEVLAVGRTSVPFDVVPGVATATAVPAFAGVAARRHRA